MKSFSPMLLGILLLSITASLSAGEVILYGGAQKPGEIGWSDASPMEVGSVLKGDFGGTFGIRYSAGRVIGFEQGIGYSPKFAKTGIKAFQTDTNLIIQAPGNIVPYGTAGIGFFRLWGREDSPVSLGPGQIAASVFRGPYLAFNYGGGLKIRRLAGPIGINIDVRNYTPHYLLGSADVSLFVLDPNFIQTTAGLVLTW
jgi:hypothetical protein